nr:hypothetical protein [Tanacetum cinerariifolium]
MLQLHKCFGKGGLRWLVVLLDHRGLSDGCGIFGGRRLRMKICIVVRIVRAEEVSEMSNLTDEYFDDVWTPEKAMEAIETYTPSKIISEYEIGNLRAQSERLSRDKKVWVALPRCMRRLSYDEPIGDLGLNSFNHEIPSSSREVPSFDKPGPQPNPLPIFPSLDVSLGDKGGPEPPIKPHSPDSFRMKVVDNLTIHTQPSPYMASFYPRDVYCYYHPCIDDPKKHYEFKPGLLGQSESLGVDFLNLEMIEDD